jgi:hypothetical protein
MNASVVSGSVLGSPGRTSTRHLFQSQFDGYAGGGGSIYGTHRVR